MNIKRTVGVTVLGIGCAIAGYFISIKIKRHHKVIQDITSTTTVMPGLANNNPPIKITLTPIDGNNNDAIVAEYSNYANTKIYFTVTSGDPHQVEIDSNESNEPIRFYRITSYDTKNPVTISVSVNKDPNVTYTNINPFPRNATHYLYTGGYYTDNFFSVVLAGDEECF